MKLFRRLTALFIVLFAFVTVLVVANVNAEDNPNPTISFADKDQRIIFNNSQQVWEQNGITVTNNKGSSNSNVGDYANPARFYANSSLTIEYPTNITSIIFNCSTAGYASDLESSVESGNASTNGKVVTVKLNTPSKSYTISKLSAQIRIDSMSLTVESFTVSFDTDGGSSFESLEVKYGDKISNPGNPEKTGYVFAGWYNGDEEWDFENDVVESDITLVAKWDDPTVNNIKNKLNVINSYVSMGYKYAFDTKEVTESVTYYKLVTNVDELEVENNVIIAAFDSDFALSTTQNGNNRGKVTIQKNGDKIDNIGEDVQVLTLETGKVDGTYALYTGEGYLFAASSDSNYLRTEEILSNNSSWEITIDSSGVATIKAQGSNTRNWLRYNSNNGIFSCYSTVQKDICIYKEVTEYVQTEKIVYSDADFRMRFAIDSTISELAELSNGDENFEYGIAVSNGGKPVTYKADEYQTNLLDEYKLVYVTFKLFDENDDFAANFDRLTSEFTVRAYVVYNGETYYSENEKTYSVKTLLEKYYKRDINDENVLQALDYLKEAFEDFGYTINK